MCCVCGKVLALGYSGSTAGYCSIFPENPLETKESTSIHVAVYCFGNMDSKVLLEIMFCISTDMKLVHVNVHAQTYILRRYKT